MKEFVPFAEPWWVNLFIFIPFASFYFWRKRGLTIASGTLLVSALFGAAFGFVEAAVVIYLCAAVGLLPGYGGTLPMSPNFPHSCIRSRKFTATCRRVY